LFIGQLAKCHVISTLNAQRLNVFNYEHGPTYIKAGKMAVIQGAHGIIYIDGQQISNRVVLIRCPDGSPVAVRVIEKALSEFEPTSLRYYAQVPWRGLKANIVLSKGMIVGFHEEVEDMRLFDTSAIRLRFYAASGEFMLDDCVLQDGDMVVAENGGVPLLAKVEFFAKSPHRCMHTGIKLMAVCLGGTTLEMEPPSRTWVGTRMHIANSS
jgi:hypothetical protein